MENGTVVQGTMVGGKLLALYCIDFQNSVFIPSQVYTANLTPIVNGSDLSNTVNGRPSSAWAPGDAVKPVVFQRTSFTITSTQSLTPTALQRYQMAAWLTTRYALPGADRTAIQYAIWQALAVKAPAGEKKPVSVLPTATGKTLTDMNNLLKQAADFVANHYSDQFFSGFRIVTQVLPIYLHGVSQVQEFMVMTPEPATLAAIVAALFCLMVFWKRRKAAPLS